MSKETKQIIKFYSITFSIGSLFIYFIFTLMIGSLNPWGWSENARINFAVITSIFGLVHFFMFPFFLDALQFERKD